MIAAGEVVERPANVVKELIENALDAKATIIEIKIKGAGRTLIRVKDNGVGMSFDDASLAFVRHATSKIKSKQDLLRIKTLGFRGEALPSIAAVSRVVLETSEGDVGTRIIIENDKQLTKEKCEARQGTIIEVSKLFYATPARLKFLKSDITEYSNIVDVVSKQALANPNVAFTLTNESGSAVIKTSGRGDLLEVIKDIYGLDTAQNMMPIKLINNDFEITGYIGKFIISKSNRNYLTLLVNQRVVRIPLLQNYIIEAYSDYIPKGRYPFVVLNIKVDPAIIDVNIHPTKSEIKIEHNDKLEDLIKEGIKNCLAGNYMIPEVNNDPAQFLQPNMDQSFSFGEMELKENVQQSKEEPTIVTTKEVGKSNNTIMMTPIGQIHGTYIVAEAPDGFYLIDQHAAMERINYEYYSKKLQDRKEQTSLLIPFVVEFSLNMINAIKDKLDLLEEAGIKAEVFGSNALKISSIPVWMSDVDLPSYITDLVEEIVNKKETNIYKLRDYAVKTMACKASLKANQHLTLSEMDHLIKRLLACDNPHNCAHGRPTMLFYSTYELQKLFMRVM